MDALYRGSEVMYTHGMAFWSNDQHPRTDDLSRCSVNYSTSRMQYPSLAPLSKISEVFVCPLGRPDQSQISPTNGRFDPLHIHQLKSTPFHYDDRGGR